MLLNFLQHTGQTPTTTDALAQMPWLRNLFWGHRAEQDSRCPPGAPLLAGHPVSPMTNDHKRKQAQLWDEPSLPENPGYSGHLLSPASSVPAADSPGGGFGGSQPETPVSRSGQPSLEPSPWTSSDSELVFRAPWRQRRPRGCPCILGAASAPPTPVC